MAFLCLPPPTKSTHMMHGIFPGELRAAFLWCLCIVWGRIAGKGKRSLTCELPQSHALLAPPLQKHIKRSLIGQEGESWLRELWEVLRKTRCKCRFHDRENSVRMTLEKKVSALITFKQSVGKITGQRCALKSSDLCNPKLRRSLKTGKNGVWLMTPGQLGLVTNSRVSVIH